MRTKLKKSIRRLFYRGKTKRIYEFFSQLKVIKNKKLSDKEAIRKHFKENTGIVPNIDKPEYLYEKILWLKTYYRNPLMTLCSDKYRVRDYVSKKGYSHILGEVIGVYDNVRDIDFNELPEKVFIKTNHTSGMNMTVEKRKANLKKVKKFFKKALKTNYYHQSREWNYKNIQPLIIIEPFIDMTQYIDYKFFVINGKVEYFAVVLDINDEHGIQSLNDKFNMYYPNGKKFSGDVKRNTFEDKNFSFYKDLDYLISIAEDLASPFPYCRVDFLVSETHVIFGEITFFPSGGNMVIYPLSLDKYYGKKLKLPYASVLQDNN